MVVVLLLLLLLSRLLRITNLPAIRLQAWCDKLLLFDND